MATVMVNQHAVRKALRNAALCAALAGCFCACSEELDVYQQVALRRAADEANARAKAAQTAKSMSEADEAKSAHTLHEIRAVVGSIEK